MWLDKHMRNNIFHTKITIVLVWVTEAVNEYYPNNRYS